MNNYFRTGSLFIPYLIIVFYVKGQTPTQTDYRRAEQFTRDSLQTKIYHASVQPQWFEDSSGFAYTTQTKNGERHFRISFDSFTKQPAFNWNRLSDSLKKMIHQDVLKKRIPLENIHWKNFYQFNFSLKGNQYKIDLKNYHISSLKPEKTTRPFRADSVLSPDRQSLIYSNSYNLFLKDIKTNSSRTLSQDGSKFYIYGSYYGWSEVMIGDGASPASHLTAQWSPDSKTIFTQIMDARKGEKMYLLNWSIDSMYRPLLLSYYRASPGDINDLTYLPVIFDQPTGRMTRINLPALPHFLGVNLRWTKDSKHLYGLYYHRGYKKMDVIEINPESGKVRTVYSDSNKTNIEYNTQFRYLEEEGIAFITSEKSGWKQLYKFTWSSGEVTPLTNGNFVVKNIEAVDTASQELFFTASGKEKEVNPYFNALYKIRFDGSHLTLLTPEPLNHEVHFSPDKKYFIDNVSSATHPTLSLLRSAQNGRILLRIDSADITALKTMDWQPPQIFRVLARDGKTTLYGALWKPTRINPNRRYPIIDFSYTGPQVSVFPNTFSKGLYSFYSSAQALAELGFIVMQVDGLGAAGRSKGFHNWSYGNMGNNLKDHVLAIKQLGRKYSWMDTGRVGIFGHSAGGYDAAHALMAFNKTYKVAVAESGDHDWRIEKAWWPEMYVGWPVDSVYQKQSNITLAPKLKGKLLLIHGGIDENVNPMETFKLSEALIKAGKYFDLLIVPSAHHGYPEAYQPYVRKKGWDFFVENLIVNPPE